MPLSMLPRKSDQVLTAVFAAALFAEKMDAQIKCHVCGCVVRGRTRRQDRLMET